MTVDPDKGFWLLPTRDRVHTNLPIFFRHARETNMTTPGVLLVNKVDYGQNQAAYQALDIPHNWSIMVCLGDDCASKMTEALTDIFTLDVQWVGLLGDDLISETADWDTRVLSQLNGWNVVSTADGAHAPKKMNGATAYSADLVRAIGYLYPPGFIHMYLDDIYEEIGQATGCWTVDMSIMVRHAHAGLTGKKDGTFAKKNESWDHDDRAFLEWKKNDKGPAVERVLALMESKGVQMFRPDLTGIEVMLATPCGDGTYERLYMESLRQTEAAVNQYGGQFRFMEAPYISEVDLARSRILGAFLRSTATHLFMIDADQAWDVRDFVRLLLADEELIAVAGVRKVSPPSFAANCSDEHGNQKPVQIDMATGFLEVTNVGGAFVCITRSCVERMIEAYPDLAYNSAEGREEYALFAPMIVNRRRLGEDFAFCERWRAIGGKIMVASDVSLRHVGKHVWEGAWLNELARKMAEEQAA